MPEKLQKKQIAMQSIFQTGKSYLNVDISYLLNFVDGIEYDLVLTHKDCVKEKLIAVANPCGNDVQLTFILNRCLDKLGQWVVDIYKKDTTNLLHSITVKVYPL